MSGIRGWRRGGLRAHRNQDTSDPSIWGFGRLFGAIKDAVIVADVRTGEILLWNQGAEGIFHYTAEQASSLNLIDLVPLRLREAHVGGMEKYATTGRGDVVDSADGVELPALRSDGTEILIQLTLSPLPKPPGLEGIYVMGLIREVTKLREAERAMQLMLDSSAQPMFCVDLDNRCSLINAAAASLLGYSPDELLGRNMHQMIHHSHPDGAPFPEQDCARNQALSDQSSLRVSDEVYWRSDGTPLPVEYQLEPLIRDGVALGAVVTFTDISERLRLEAESAERESQLRESANTDALTGVGNRRHVDALLGSLLPGDAVVMIDIDHFKEINDRLGHLEGDRLLISLASHLQEQLREEDGVARYGGEEFLVLLRGAKERGLAFVNRIAENWSKKNSGITFSAGIAVHQPDEFADRTLKRADEAMYEAKRSGRDCVIESA
jgi:diguanylate cyclase (GGDEF)-like protein/PAS domain S-box-containing protein